MIKLLAFDAATDVCSVALDNGTQRWLRYSDTPRSHAQMLLPYIDELIRESQIPLNSLSAIALTHGPGSFTGIRIALSIAQGLSYASNVPIIPVSSLDALAYTYLHSGGHTALCEGDCVITAFDARMNEVYWAAYVYVDGKLLQIQAPSICGVDDFPRVWRTVLAEQTHVHTDLAQNLGSKHEGESLAVYALGHGWAIAALAEQAHIDRLIVFADMFPSASSVIEFVYAQVRNLPSAGSDEERILSLSCSASDLEPLYLRNEVTWKKRVRIRSLEC